MEKNHVLNHSPSLFDAPGTKAFALEHHKLTVNQFANVAKIAKQFRSKTARRPIIISR